MKITKEEFQRIGKERPLELFNQGIKAQETREKYTRTLRHVLCKIFEDIFEGDFEDRVNQFVKLSREDSDWTRDLLVNLSIKLKERTKLPRDNSEYLNPNSIDNYFKPIKKLFDMNGVVISWKRVYATFPEQDNVSDSRGWSRDEIQKMLKFSNGSIDRAILLVASSSGIRVGGFDLNWQDLIPIYQIGDQLKIDITESEKESSEVACAMLRIYQGTSYSYPAFITPEAFEALTDYKSDWTRDVGRAPRPEDPIFKKEGEILRRATPIGIKKRVERMIKRAGLRDSIKGKRYEVPIMNGFRRFWNKTCKESLSRDSPLGSLIKKEFMMGHTGLIKLDKNYFKTHVLELAEEYLGAIPNLTISNEKRLRLENKKKTEKIEKMERQQREIDFLKNEVKRIDLRAKIAEEIKQGMLEWSEEHPDQIPPRNIAKADFTKTPSLDNIVEHFLKEHDGDINGLREMFAKYAKYTIRDDGTIST